MVSEGSISLANAVFSEYATVKPASSGASSSARLVETTSWSRPRLLECWLKKSVDKIPLSFQGLVAFRRTERPPWSFLACPDWLNGMRPAAPPSGERQPTDHELSIRWTNNFSFLAATGLVL